MLSSCSGSLDPLQGPLDFPWPDIENHSCVQINVAEETKCAVRGPLVPSRWGGPQYNGAARRTAMDNSAQRDTISFLWPTAPTLPALRHFSGAAQQQFSALYKSAHTDIQGRPSWTQTQWRYFNLSIGLSVAERLQDDQIRSALSI